MTAPLFPQNRPALRLVPSKHDKLRRPGIETPVGELYWITADGRPLRLTTSGLVTDPKFSPDRNSCAYIEGQILGYADKDAPIKNGRYQEFPTYFPKRIVVRKNQRIVARFTPEKLYAVRWQWVDNSRIATASQGSHGPVYLELWDARTGRRLEKRMEYEENLPTWTVGLTDH
jgi:hypothetical protein